MNFIWSHSCSEDELDPLPNREGILALDSSKDPVGVAAQHQCAVIIVSVKNTEDACRAIQVIEESQGEYAVWVYQPSATVESTMTLVKAGAAHVVTTIDEIEDAMNTATEGLACESVSNKMLIGTSRSMRAVSSSIELVADRRCNVLIEGETGSGKEVVAQAIHRSGNRSRGPWIAVNCGAIPETLLEAELFGHVKGAFTGAVQGRIGKFEAANHGTIFLDEIGDMPFAVQAKLLRVLQEKEVERLGGNERIRLDVRVIAATNVNLEDRVREGLFRQDLYYRLNVFRIVLPALRDRLGDLSALANHLVAKVCENENLQSKRLDSSALNQLLQHTWPGNVRELENVMEMAVIHSGSRSSILASDIRIGPRPVHAVCSEQPARVSIPSIGLDYQQALETFERDLLTQALTRTRGNKTAAAELLHLKRTTLSARMRVLEARLPRLVA
jgi:transcriptional regulator with PAS, ATPase and Fis domain